MYIRIKNQASQLRFVIVQEIKRLEQEAEEKDKDFSAVIHRLSSAKRAIAQLEDGKEVTQTTIDALVNIKLSEIETFLFNNASLLRRLFPSLRIEIYG